MRPSSMDFIYFSITALTRLVLEYIGKLCCFQFSISNIFVKGKGASSNVHHDLEKFNAIPQDKMNIKTAIKRNTKNKNKNKNKTSSIYREHILSLIRRKNEFYGRNGIDLPHLPGKFKLRRFRMKIDRNLRAVP